MVFNDWHKECINFLELNTTDQKKYPSKYPKLNFFSPLNSICPNCSHSIKIIDNIPILSFIILKAKCRYCQQKISWQYPLIELLSCIASLSVVLIWGLNITSLAILLLTYLLIVISGIDFKYLIIPDSLNYIGLWLGLVLNASMFKIVPLHFAVLGAVLGYLFLWSIYWLFKLIRGKEGFGYGDFKLAALFGAWFGFFNLFPMLIISSIVAIVFSIIAYFTHKRTMDQPFPFGPYLAIAGWLVLLFKI
jgi:leader peptidase (prepilin peptidase)/N-methyltransferase